MVKNKVDYGVLDSNSQWQITQKGCALVMKFNERLVPVLQVISSDGRLIITPAAKKKKKHGHGLGSLPSTRPHKIHKFCLVFHRTQKKRYKDFLSLILKFWVHQQENQTTHSSADGDNKTQAQSSSSSSSSSSTPSPSDRDVSIMQHVVNAGVDGRDCEAEINRVMLRLQSDPHFQAYVDAAEKALSQYI